MWKALQLLVLSEPVNCWLALAPESLEPCCTVITPAAANFYECSMQAIMQLMVVTEK